VDVAEIAAAVAPHGDVTGVLEAELPAGGRYFLVAFGEAAGWLVVDAGAKPVDDRSVVREVASLVAMSEIAAELAGEDDVARVASASYLDRVGSAALGSAAGVVDAFVGDVELGYRLPLR
jgi:hypothetical protein